MNIFKTMILMALMTALFLFCGMALGGTGGLMIAGGLALVMNFFSYWFSAKLVLMMYGGKEVTRAEAPRLFGIVEKLSSKAQMPMPKVYILPSPQPNAFATGRNPANAAVAATEGILQMLNDRELEGVIAHEMMHVKHYDILIGTIVGTMAGAISMLASMARWGAILGGMGGRDRDDDGGGVIGLLVMSIVVPLIAFLVQMAVSRSREYHADQGAGELTGDPLALAEALKKIHYGVQQIPMREAGPATAHLFIASPLSAEGVFSLLSTHPPFEKRVRMLEEQAVALRGYRG